MPPKVARTGGGSKTQPPKTMAKASSSSKSSGSSKMSSSSGVKKSAPPVTSKPKNVDKVDFGKPKPQADAGVYHKPRLIAAATGRDPEPPKAKPKNDDYDPMIMTPSQRHEILNHIHKDAKEFSKTEMGHAVGAAVIGGAAGAAGAAAGGSVGAGAAVGATSSFIGQITKAVEKVAEVVVDALGTMGEGILEDDLP